MESTLGIPYTHPPELHELEPKSLELMRRRLDQLNQSKRLTDIARKEVGGGHQLAIKEPTGNTLMDWDYSVDPRKWKYQSKTLLARIEKGPPTPREILNPNCDPAYKNERHVTDVKVSACLSPLWGWKFGKLLELFPIFEKINLDKVFIVGLAEVIATPPAKQCFYIAYARSDSSYGKGSYERSFEGGYIHCLDSHFAIGPSSDPKPLVEAIKIAALAKFKHRDPTKPMGVEDWAKRVGADRTGLFTSPTTIHFGRNQGFPILT